MKNFVCIGKKRCYVYLTLIYPPEGCRSRTIRAFEDTICRRMAVEIFSRVPWAGI